MVFGDLNEKPGFQWKPEEPIKEIRIPIPGEAVSTAHVVLEVILAVNELIRRENERSADQ